MYRITMKNKAGFTLTEIMVSSLILLSTSVAFTAGMLGALRTHQMSSDYYLATCIARNRIQRARSIDFFTLPQMVENQRRVDEMGNGSTSGTFRRTTTVNDVTGNQVEVIVQVYFPAGRKVLSDEPIEVRTKITNGM